MSNVKNDLIIEIEKRVNDKILEPSNAELLKKLILNADSDNEAMSIAEQVQRTKEQDCISISDW